MSTVPATSDAEASVAEAKAASARLWEVAGRPFIATDRERCLALIEANADDIAETSGPMARREALRQLVGFIRDGVEAGKPLPFDGRVRSRAATVITRALLSRIALVFRRTPTIWTNRTRANASVPRTGLLALGAWSTSMSANTKEERRVTEAEYGSRPVYWSSLPVGDIGDGYWSSIAILRDTCEDDDVEVPAEVHGCVPSHLILESAERIIESALEEHHEDAGVPDEAIADLQAALAAWQEKWSGAVTSWGEDPTTIVVLDVELT